MSLCLIVWGGGVSLSSLKEGSLQINVKLSGVITSRKWSKFCPGDRGLFMNNNGSHTQARGSPSDWMAITIAVAKPGQENPTWWFDEFDIKQKIPRDRDGLYTAITWQQEMSAGTIMSTVSTVTIAHQRSCHTAFFWSPRLVLVEKQKQSDLASVWSDAFFTWQLCSIKWRIWTLEAYNSQPMIKNWINLLAERWKHLQQTREVDQKNK